MRSIPLSGVGGFQLYAVSDAVALAATTSVAPTKARELLDEAAETHRALAGIASIANALARWQIGPLEAVLFDTIGSTTLTTVVTRLQQLQGGLRMDTIASLSEAVSGAMAAAHRRSLKGKPVTFGAIVPSRVVVTQEGALKITGLGEGLARASISRSAAIQVVAPQGVATQDFSVASDLALLGTFLQWLIARATMPVALTRVIQGRELPEDASLSAAWVRARNVMRGSSGAQSVEEAMVPVRALWTALGVEQHQINAATPLAQSLSQMTAQVDIAPSGAAFALPGVQPIVLPRRSPLRKILWGLVESRMSQPGTTLDTDSIARLGWPREILSKSAASSRVYVAVNSLRKRGLAAVLQRTPQGYLLDPGADVRINPELGVLAASLTDTQFQTAT